MQEYIKKILGSGHNTTLIISNDEMEDILKIVRSLEDSGFWILDSEVSETIKNEAKGQKEGFLSMLLVTLVARLLGNMLAGKGVGERTSGCGLKKKTNSTTSFNKL